MAYQIDLALPDGRRHRETAGTTIEEARRRLAQVRREIAEGTFNPGAGTGAQSLATWAETWLAARRKAGKVRSVEVEARLYREHVQPYPLAGIALDAIRPRHVIEWIDSVTRSGRLSAKSIRNAHGVISAMLAGARVKDLIADNPAKGLPRGTFPETVEGRPRREVAAWTRAEVAALISHPGVPADRRMLYALSALTGCRLGEAAGLRWRDLDRAARPLWLWTLRTQYDGRPLKGGGARPRFVPIHPELQTRLEAWEREGWERFVCRRPTSDDFVIPKANGTPYTNENAVGAKAVRRHAARAGVTPGARDFHSFRRAFVTLARTCGAPADVVERVTHNAKGAMIDRYTFFGWEPLCAAVSCVRVAAPDGSTADVAGARRIASTAQSTAQAGNGVAMAAISQEDLPGIHGDGWNRRPDQGGPRRVSPENTGPDAPPDVFAGRVDPEGSAIIPSRGTAVPSVACGLLALAADLDAAGQHDAAERVRATVRGLG